MMLGRCKEGVFKGDLLLVEFRDREVFDGFEDRVRGHGGAAKFDIHDGN